MPLVSVVIPTFNRYPLVCQAIESVLNQSFQDFELLIIDDGSTDQTKTEIQKYLKDERVQIFSQPNRGVAAARNVGIQKAQAHWVAFLDSDDVWYPDKLAKQWQAVCQNPEIKICQTEDCWFRYGKRVNPKKKHAKKSGWIFNDCVDLCIVCCSTVMIHKEVFDTCGVFDENLPACEDYDLWLRIALHYPIITLPDELAAKYGGHEDQLSRRYWGMDRFRLYALKKLTQLDLTEDQRNLVEKNIHFRYTILKQGFEKRGKTFKEWGTH